MPVPTMGPTIRTYCWIIEIQSHPNGVGKMQQVKAVQGNMGHSLLATLSEMASRAYAAVSERNAQRASVRHLRTLSDYHLKDLGIDRSEIMSVVYSDTSDRIRD